MKASLIVAAIFSLHALVNGQCTPIGQGGCADIPGGAANLPWCGQAEVVHDGKTEQIGDYKVFWKGGFFHNGYAGESFVMVFTLQSSEKWK